MVDDKPLPALFEHCRRAYRAMLDEAEAVSKGSAGEIIVYEGFLTKLITHELNLSVPYYTLVLNRLTDMGCIRQLKRGGGNAKSQWELIYEPNEEAFLTAEPSKVPKQDKHAATQDQIDQLMSRVAYLENLMQEVLTALAAQHGVEEVIE